MSGKLGAFCVVSPRNVGAHHFNGRVRLLALPQLSRAVRAAEGDKREGGLRYGASIAVAPECIERDGMIAFVPLEEALTEMHVTCHRG